MADPRIAIVGAGGIGGFLGAKLARAGVDVSLIARGAHLDALQTTGITVRDQAQELHLDHIPAFASAAEVGPVDVVLFAVKMTDLDAAAKSCAPIVRPGTRLVTFQNGVEAPTLLRAIYPDACVLPGVAYIVTSIVAPGVIEKTGPSARFEISAQTAADMERARDVVQLLAGAKIDAHLMDDATVMLWNKFIMLAATSSMTAYTRQPMGHMQTDPAAQAMMVEAVREGINVARAKGINLSENIEALTLHRLNEVMHKEAKASQLVDLERGKPLELQWLSGAIHRLGQETGVPTPVHSMIFEALQPFAAGKKR